MRRYEVVFVLAPDLADDIVEETIETFKGVAEEMGAKVLGVDRWDKRPMAFPVKKFKEGTYVFLNIEEEAGQAATELERRFKVSEAVIRYLTIRSDQQNKRVKKILAKRARRKAAADEASAETAAATAAASESAGTD